MKPPRIQSNFQVFDLDDERCEITMEKLLIRVEMLRMISYEALTNLGRKQPTRFGGLPFTFEPGWQVNVFDSSEEQSAGLHEPF